MKGVSIRRLASLPVTAPCWPRTIWLRIRHTPETRCFASFNPNSAMALHSVKESKRLFRRVRVQVPGGIKAARTSWLITVMSWSPTTKKLRAPREARSSQGTEQTKCVLLVRQSHLARLAEAGHHSRGDGQEVTMTTCAGTLLNNDAFEGRFGQIGVCEGA